MLFNLLIADVEEGLERQSEGSKTEEGRKLKVLGYADNLVIQSRRRGGYEVVNKKIRVLS